MTPLGAFVSSLVLAEAYNQYTPPAEKRNWQSSVKMHHGEAGVILAILGALVGSKTAAAFGLGLALHDRRDANQWFKT